MTNGVQNEMDLADIEAKECLDDGTVEKVIREQRAFALQEQGLDSAIEELVKLENEVRSAGDVSGTQNVIVAIVQLCYEARAWKTLIDQILFLSQRQAQSKQVIVAMIQQAMAYLDDVPDLETRIKLVETLSSVSTIKGLQNTCWCFIMAPQEKPVISSTKPDLVDLNLSTLDHSREWLQEQYHGEARIENQIQEHTQQQQLSFNSDTRPCTPPQQRVEWRDLSPSICRAPLKKRANTNILRKPLRPIRRRLFDQPSAEDVEEFLSGLEQRDQQRFIDRYNFDPVKEEPLTGRYEWSPLKPHRPQLTRATSVDSSAGVRRSELAPTLSA